MDLAGDYFPPKLSVGSQRDVKALEVKNGNQQGDFTLLVFMLCAWAPAPWPDLITADRPF